MSAATEQAPFQRLIKLIERELELAGQGRLEELDAAVAETGAYMALLPSPAPDSAQQLVLRADALRSRVIIEVTRLKDSIAVTRSAQRRSRRVARRYGPPRSGRISTSA